jgi:hypothetical protein
VSDQPPQRDPFEDWIDAEGVRDVFELHPELKDVARKYAEADPRVAQAEAALRDEWHAYLMKHREWLAEVSHQGAAAFDRTLIALSSGAIALSITFLNVLGPVAEIPRSLVLAWVALVASILLTVASMATSRWLVQNEIAAVDDFLKNPPSYLEEQKLDEKLRRRSKRLERTTIWLSGFAGLVFVTGVLALIFFAINAREGVNGKRESAAATAEEGRRGLRAPAASAAEEGQRKEGIRAPAAPAQTEPAVREAEPVKR